ncbi:hypothetical protein PsorP6_010179 [Peronosclerospora sorghi]|uniref:Uncharacterized protein n=1 Tax=Peronosclerospora sorghi TaxID=230839 RepID=A0ACC0VTU9_9STRA|nr:hypothetical protein PsorP6_010179 [Peronosclerospora sorghi]
MQDHIEATCSKERNEASEERSRTFTVEGRPFKFVDSSTSADGSKHRGETRCVDITSAESCSREGFGLPRSRVSTEKLGKFTCRTNDVAS